MSFRFVLHTVSFPDHRVDFSFGSIIIEIRDKIQYADDIDVEDLVSRLDRLGYHCNLAIKEFSKRET